MTTNNKSIIEWTNEKFGTEYSTKDFDEIKNFLLLWNIYEKIIFGTNFTIEKLDHEINNLDLDIKRFQNVEKGQVCTFYFIIWAV